MDIATEERPAIPPGEDDLPYDFGPPLESNHHRDAMNALIESLRLHWRDLPDGYVGGNMALYFSLRQIEHNDFVGPDVFVVLGASRRERKSWVVWQEGLVPDVVIELLSAGTERRDRGDKMRIYERQMRVPFYVLFHPFDARFDVFELRDLAYQPRVADESGRVAVPPLGLELGVVWSVVEGERLPWLRWFTPEGVMLPTPIELAHIAERRADEAEAEAAAERDRAEQAEARAAAAEAQAAALAERLRALGLD